MGDVLGPYDQADFRVMSILRSNLKYYYKDYSKNKVLIDKETSLYKLFINKEVA